MTLRVRNTLSRAVEPLLPIDGPSPPGRTGLVRMYTCGPTVYRYAHIGNLRSFLLADLVRRALLYHGVQVLHVKNITDVGHMRDEQLDAGGDRVLVQAEAEGRSPQEIASHYEAAFHEDEAAVNILAAHRFPRATEHIADMVALAEALEDRGLAYRAPDRTLYFDTSRDPQYGRLSGNTLDSLRAGHRADPAPGKRDPADFALWKCAEPGRSMRWPTTRWGEGFPGWHLECSAMAQRYLGDEFELHTGGIDNVFPHHEDEIAQSAGVTGRSPARHWVHGAHLFTGGQKMAKSAGNVRRVTDLRAHGTDPLAFRYLMLTSRYRHRLEYSEGSIRGAAAALDSLRARLRALSPPPGEGPWSAPAVLHARPAGGRPEGVVSHAAGHGAAHDAPFAPSDRAHEPSAPLSERGCQLHDRFVAALDDDLDLPSALAIVRDTLRADLVLDEKRWLVLDADLVLGLDLDRVWDEGPASGLPDDARALLDERDAARAAGDYARADELRARLRDLGVAVVDEAGGKGRWRRLP